MIIEQNDIDLVKKLEGYTYQKSMKGVVKEADQKHFKDLKIRLRSLARFYKNKHDIDSGVFTAVTSSGNPISRHSSLRPVWSGLFKGSENKQYSAQISFVINPNENCLDVGFYFGNASATGLETDTRKKWEQDLKNLGKLLYTEISGSSDLQSAYHELFEFGFKAKVNGQRYTPVAWLNNLNVDPRHSAVLFNLKPNPDGVIELSNIDLCVAMLIPLIRVLPQKISEQRKKLPVKSRALTPEQRAKQAERRALIGLEGEKYIMKMEEIKLRQMGFKDLTPHLIHKSLISDSFGYDILSKDLESKEIFIEVKTTTFMKGDAGANVFYLSSDEYEFYLNNKVQYRLFRVYDIYGNPSYEILDLDKISKKTNSYRMEIK